MPRRPRQNRSPSSTALRLGTVAERLRALRRERDRLVRQIGAKQVQVDTVFQSARDAASILYEKLPSLVERRRGLIRDIRAVFIELLGRPRVARKAQRAVLEVLEVLAQSGMLDDELDVSLRENGEDFAPDSSWGRPSDTENRPSDSGGRGRGRGPEPEWDGQRAGASAAHVGGQADKASVREVFRRLAIALHPDRTQHEAEKQRRTEVMKEVTRAYEEGDLAGLLQIEAMWLAGVTVVAEGQDAERQATALERIVGDLKRQLKELTRKLRELKRTSPLEGLEDFASAQPGRSPIEALLAQAEQELDTLSEIRDRARAYRDRKISLDQFLRGLDILNDPPYGDADFAAEMDLFEKVLAEELEFETAPAPKKKKGARKRKP